MRQSIKTDTYTTLVNDIAEIYSRARKMLVESYWQIGRRIAEQEQRGDGKGSARNKLDILGFKCAVDLVAPIEPDRRCSGLQ